MALSANPTKLSSEQLVPGEEEKLLLLAKAGVLDRDRDGLWFLPRISKGSTELTGACFVLPTGDEKLSFPQRIKRLVYTAWDFFFSSTIIWS